MRWWTFSGILSLPMMTARRRSNINKSFLRLPNEKPALISQRGLLQITPAATYSRASYTGTTIGPAAFHGRVRNGNGWDHCGKTTGKLLQCRKLRGRDSSLHSE